MNDDDSRDPQATADRPLWVESGHWRHYSAWGQVWSCRLLINTLLLALGLVQSEAQPCPILIVENMSMLQFAAGSAELSQPVRIQLDHWIVIASRRTYPTRFQLIGQADRVGSAEANRRLSFRRADAVRRYLIGRGIARTLISVRAEGEDFGVVETADEVPEPTNRVVQLLAIADQRERQDIVRVCPANRPATG